MDLVGCGCDSGFLSGNGAETGIVIMLYLRVEYYYFVELALCINAGWPLLRNIRVFQHDSGTC